MEHQLEQMAYVGDTPWHDLGKQLTPNQPIEVWAQQAGVDWRIESANVSYMARNDNGVYPDVRYGVIRMNAGDTWKYGTTANGVGRYIQRNLDNLYLKQITLYRGTTYQSLAQEKMLLIQYGQIHGFLPPGNKFYK